MGKPDFEKPQFSEIAWKSIDIEWASIAQHDHLFVAEFVGRSLKFRQGWRQGRHCGCEDQSRAGTGRDLPALEQQIHDETGCIAAVTSGPERIRLSVSGS